MAKGMIKSVRVVNEFGDHSCPHCGVMFITPAGLELKAGKATCGICGKEYMVGKITAQAANENKQKYDKACDKVIKELASA